MYFSSEENTAVDTKYVTLTLVEVDPRPGAGGTQPLPFGPIIPRQCEYTWTEIRTLANNAGKDKATNKTRKDERQQECGILSALAQMCKRGQGGGVAS